MTFLDLLEKKGLTMYKLAKESGLGQATIHEIVSGKRKNIRFDTAMKIAHTLGVKEKVIQDCIRGCEYDGNKERDN